MPAAVRYPWMFRTAAVLFILLGASLLWRFALTGYQPQYRPYGLASGIAALTIGAFLFRPARVAVGASAGVSAFICLCATVAAPIGHGPVILFFAALAIVCGGYAVFAVRALGQGTKTRELMMTKFLMVLAMLVVLASVPNSAVPAMATDTAAAPGPRQIADAAMKFVAAEDMKGLFEFIGRNMAMERGELMKIRDTIVDQRKQIGGALGKPMGFAFVSECRRSEILVRLLYAEKREKNAMRWEFIFYKPRDVWTMASFHWDNNFQGLFAPCN